MRDYNPTHRVLDFGEERYDLLEHGDVVVTRSFDLEESGLLERAPLDRYYRIPGISDAAWWRRVPALGKLSSFAWRELPGAKVVIHHKQWTRRVMTKSGEHRMIEAHELPTGYCPEARNAELVRLFDQAKRVFPDATIIEAPDELRVAARRHRWGVAPYHYIPEYYEYVRDRLIEAGAIHAEPLAHAAE